MTTQRLHRLFLDAIRRDVELFFNSRRLCIAIPESHESLVGTILDYGVPDLVGRSLASTTRRKQFLSELESLLRMHEPRFQSVKIEPIGDNDERDRSIQFRIDAVVHAEPAPESLTFSSNLEPISQSFSVNL